MATYPMAIANSHRRLLLSTLTLLWIATAKASSQSLELSSRLPRDPLTVQGQSGGTVDSKDCGYIAPAPNQVLTLTSRLDYLRLSLQSTGGQPTLLVEGPGGRFCSMANSLSGSNPQISGVWLPGRYAVYVGDRSGDRHTFTLVISQQQ